MLNKIGGRDWKRGSEGFVVLCFYLVLFNFKIMCTYFFDK